ncbi:histone-lysine N-methyltransferase SUV39H1 isoform X3 [Sminthopsis crassicaudata]|uniref:histone-lysine N-methyltransferase SUV39H1 isoform X3 n=1 Tax=Sminthopsis crassicaudata TaxID=9301 RepID=UPI003D69FB2F
MPGPWSLRPRPGPTSRSRPSSARGKFSRVSGLPWPMSLALRGGKMAENLKACSVGAKYSLNQLENLCRMAKLCCHDLGITKNNMCIFEVDYLCNYRKIDDKEYYLVKWKGYPKSENTWEPRWNLRCAATLKQFHRDVEGELFRRTGRRPRARPPRHLDAAMVNFLEQKAKQRKALRRWEKELNLARAHKGSIAVENEVDLFWPPEDFTYINEYRVGEGISLEQVTVGCECKNCLEAPVNGCCPGASLNQFAYNIQGQVRLEAGQPIYECNSHCLCDIQCPNRVVQRGTYYNLCIFRTDNGRGWGVRTQEKIRRHTFVMEYVGECSPNLQVYNVFIDNLDERLPRIAFFATRTIWAGEELTFDYNMQVDLVHMESMRMDSNFRLAGLIGSPKKRVRMACKCGAEFCRKYLF